MLAGVQTVKKPRPLNELLLKLGLFAAICPKTRFGCEFSDIFTVFFFGFIKKVRGLLSHGLNQGLDFHHVDGSHRCRIIQIETGCTKMN